MKSLILRDHEVRGLVETGKVLIVRPVKPQPNFGGAIFWDAVNEVWHNAICATYHSASKTWDYPYGKPGEQLYVRENWKYYDWTEEGLPFIQYKSDNETRLIEDLLTDEWGEKVGDIWAELSTPENIKKHRAARDTKWRPSIHMPRWASRLTAEVESVDAKRIQELGIDEDNAIQTGHKSTFVLTPNGDDYTGLYPSEHFRDSWDSRYAKAGLGWDTNCWAWFAIVKRAEA